MADKTNAEIRQEFRDAMPPMSDEDWALFCERMAARMRGEPHVHTRLCGCEDGDRST